MEFEEQKRGFVTKNVTEIFKQNELFISYIKELDRVKGEEWSRKDSKINDVESLIRVFFGMLYKRLS